MSCQATCKGKPKFCNILKKGTACSMERWCGRVALVTGASVGIGAAICRKLVKSGLTVVGCARNLQKLHELANEDEVKKATGRLDVVKCDLSEESDILNLFDVIRSKYGQIDICINNAGFSTDSPLLTGQTEDWKKMFDVNVLGLCICAREAVKLMQEKSINDGQIINISSIGGHRLPLTDMPGFTFYCGTKFMVRCITEGLRREVKGLNRNIRVSTISPGLVETEFVHRAVGADKAEDMHKQMPSLQGNDIADAVLYILQCPRHVDVNDIVVTPVGSTL